MKKTTVHVVLAVLIAVTALFTMQGCSQGISTDIGYGETPNPPPPNPNPGATPTPNPGDLSITGPTVTPEQPAGVISGTVEISATVTGPAVSQVEFYANDSLIGVDTTAPYSVTRNTVLMPNPVRLRAKVRATTGAFLDTPEKTFTIDNTSPVLTAFTASSGNPADPEGTYSGLVHFTATGTDASGIGKVEFLLDDVVIGTDTTEPFEFDWDSTTAPNGPHTFTAKIYDKTSGGNPTTSAPLDAFIDNGGPAITITSPVHHQFISGTITVSATAAVDPEDPTDPVVELVFTAPAGLVDTNPDPTIFSATFDTTAVPEGPLTFTARARSAAGKLSFKSVTPTVDNVAFDGVIPLTPPFFTGGDFGSTVAFVGDTNNDGFDDVALASPNADITTINDGVVVIFRGPAFNNYVVINNPEPDFNARFGTAVSAAGDIDGDGFDDVAISAPGAKVGGLVNSGKVYVFKGPNFVEHITIANPFSQGGEEFGYAIAGGKDIAGSAAPDLIITAPKWNLDQFSLRYGRAYLVKGPTFSEFTLIPAPDQQWDARFGETAAIVGDTNGDNKADYVIGAPNFDKVVPTLQNSGRVYFYVAPATLSKTLEDPAPQHSGYFGSSVSSAGDLNGDGKFDLIIGESGYDADTGRAYYAIAPAFNLSAPLLRPSGAAGNLFGASVAGAGDLNNDGHKDLAVGAPNADEVVIFLGPDFTQKLIKHHPSGSTGINFGVSMAGGGDVNNDGLGDLVVGASSAPPVGGGAVFYNP